MSKLIFIFVLIGLCLSNDPDCSSKFEEILSELCGQIKVGCKYFSARKLCTTNGDCSDGTREKCKDIIPSDYPRYKCAFEGSCSKTLRLCEEYISDSEIKCDLLTAKSGEGDECRFSYSGKCTPHFNSCDTLPKDKCNNNIPSPLYYKCVWNSSANKCQSVRRSCDDTYISPSESNCKSLESSDTNKKCYYLNDVNEDACTEYYEKCEAFTARDSTGCQNIKPLNEDKNGFDKTKKCVYNSREAVTCQTKDILCEEYVLGEKEDYKICYQLQVEDSSKKKCVYDFQNKTCKVAYKTCETYNNLSIDEKRKISCKDIILEDKYQICALNDDNQCETKVRKCTDYKSYEPKTYCESYASAGSSKICKLNVSECFEDYEDCENYKGKDKTTCESITPSIKGAKCILELDSKCIPYLPCSQAKTEDDCEKALPEGNDYSKTCLFFNGQCIEEYKTCENYIGYLKNDCEKIIQINGKKCQFVDGFCKSFNKLCSEGISQIDCSKIKRFSEPLKKICEYDKSSGSCFENYKYCSDYIGNDADSCTKIKPYKPETNDPETAYECVYNEKVGCEKKLLDCSMAVGKKDLCEEISGLLEENSGDKKYCAYINDNCTEQYIHCEDYSKDIKEEVCEAIIPKDYIKKHCYFDENKKCVSVDNVCEEFNINDYEYQCLDISPFCSFSDGICTQIEKNCSDITFFTVKDSNKDDCESIDLSKENKTCVLSDDQLKCEVKDMPSPSESSQTSSSSSTPAQSSSSKSQDNTEEKSYSGFLGAKKVKFILIILCLLI